MRRLLLGLVLVTLLAPAAWAAELPVADGFLVDAAQVIPDAQEARLEADLQAYSDRSTNQIGVAVVDTIGDRSIEDYARELFNEWGVGMASENNGVLLVIAVGSRLSRIEVGAGLTAQLTDDDAATILADFAFFARRGDFAGGVEQAERAIRTTLGDTDAQDPLPVPDAALDDAPSDFGGGTTPFEPTEDPLQGISGSTLLSFLGPALLMGLLLTRSTMRRGRYGGGYGRRSPGLGLGTGLLFGTLLNQGGHSSSGSSGSSGGGGDGGGSGGGSWGGGGFGGGSSGGGGASGGW